MSAGFWVCVTGLCDSPDSANPRISAGLRGYRGCRNGTWKCNKPVNPHRLVHFCHVFQWLAYFGGAEGRHHHVRGAKRRLKPTVRVTPRWRTSMSHLIIRLPTEINPVPGRGAAQPSPGRARQGRFPGCGTGKTIPPSIRYSTGPRAAYGAQRRLTGNRAIGAAARRTSEHIA